MASPVSVGKLSVEISSNIAKSLKSIDQLIGRIKEANKQTNSLAASFSYVASSSNKLSTGSQVPKLTKQLNEFSKAAEEAQKKWSAVGATPPTGLTKSSFLSLSEYKQTPEGLRAAAEAQAKIANAQSYFSSVGATPSTGLTKANFFTASELNQINEALSQTTQSTQEMVAAQQLFSSVGSTAFTGITEDMLLTADAASEQETELMRLGAAFRSLPSFIDYASSGFQSFLSYVKNVSIGIDTFISGLGRALYSLRKLINIGREGFEATSSYIENYNLFNVSMKGSTDEAFKFQYAMNEAVGTNMSNTMRFQGFFKNLAANLGIATDKAMMLSETMTTLSYDLASLYNADVQTAFNKLSSALVGQTKPLREWGVDVTQQTLSMYLLELGIESEVTTLTQAQKVMLRYIAILKQTTSAQGDYARSIEAPANQIRMFTELLGQLQIWFGAVFTKVIGAVLPYVNAFVMALTNVFKWIAKLVGFNLGDYNFLAASSAASEFEEELASVTDTSEELQKSLAGFDEINLLGSQTASDTDSLLGDLAITKALEDAMAGYNNLLSEADTKASQIADSIMSWLGFTQQVDSKTGEINWTYAGSNKAINFIVESFKFLSDAIGEVGKFARDNKIDLEDVFNVLIVFFEFLMAYKIIALLGNFVTPWTLLGIAIAGVVTYADDIRDWFDSLTWIEQKSVGVITALLGIAMAVAAVNIALTGGLSAKTILAGFAGLGLATFGVGLATGIIGGESSSTNSDFNLLDPKYSYANTGIPLRSDNETSVFNPLNSNYLNGITFRANGGFVNSGELFVAREAGAEMVGSIGGRTAVANNDQIVAAVSQGVASAVSSVIGNGSNQTVNIYLDDVLVGNALIDSINRATKNTGNTVMVG